MKLKTHIYLFLVHLSCSAVVTLCPHLSTDETMNNSHTHLGLSVPASEIGPLPLKSIKHQSLHTDTAVQ